MNEAIDYIVKIKQIIEDVNSEFTKLNSQLQRHDLIECDILHMLEQQDKLSAVKGYKYAKLLKDNRNQRRLVKNELDMIKSLSCRFEDIMPKINKAEDKITSIKEEQKVRYYTLRILNEEEFK